MGTLKSSVLKQNFRLNQKLVAVLATCFLVACDPPVQDQVIVPETLRATDIRQASHFSVEDGDCAGVLRANLSGHGLNLEPASRVDASLRLQLSQLRPLREHLPIIKTLGWQAKYRLEVRGAEQKTLLNLYGQEGSLSFQELCDDIGDEIANKLNDYLLKKRP